MSSETVMKVVKIKLKSFDKSLVERSVKQLVSVAKKHGASVKGAIPLPSKVSRYIVTKSPNRHKKSREQYQIVDFKRLVILTGFGREFMKSLSSVQFSAGVYVKVVA